MKLCPISSELSYCHGKNASAEPPVEVCGARGGECGGGGRHDELLGDVGLGDAGLPGRPRRALTAGSESECGECELREQERSVGQQLGQEVRALPSEESEK